MAHININHPSAGAVREQGKRRGEPRVEGCTRPGERRRSMTAPLSHLGVDTQGRWSDLAVNPTDPNLLGLTPWTHLATHARQRQHPLTRRAGCEKPSLTYVVVIVLVRRHLRPASVDFSLSAGNTDTQEFPVARYHPTVDALACAV